MQMNLLICRKTIPVLVLILFVVLSFCNAENQKTVEVVGVGECADCHLNNIKNSHAFRGLKVTIDCKLANGGMKTRGEGKLNEEGKFQVSFPKELVENGKLKEECYAQLRSVSNTPCPTFNGLDAIKLAFVSESNGKHTFSPNGKLKFSPSTCTSAFLWPFFKHPNFPKLPDLSHWPKKSIPKLTFPPIKWPDPHKFFPKKPFPCPPFFKKPFPHVPIFKKPLPPPVPIYKPPLPPPVPIYEKPLPPPVPIYEKPLPPPVPIVKKPCPPIKKPLPPPVPIVKKPCPPIKKPLPPPVPVVEKPLPPPVPIVKKPLPPPVPIVKKPCPPIFKKPPIPVYKPKPLPPLPKIPPFPKKPCPPLTIPKLPPIPKKPWPPLTIPKLPPFPKFEHPKFKKWPPLPLIPSHP